MPPYRPDLPGLESAVTKMKRGAAGLPERVAQLVPGHGRDQERRAQGATAGEGVVVDLGEQVQPLGLAADGLGHHGACQPRRDQAVAGEALGEVEIGCQPTPVRGAVERDVDHPAPQIFDADVVQLREDAMHAPCHHAAQVGRRHRGVAGTAAEQQAVVASQPEVVQRPVGVGHRHVIADQIACARLAERRRGGDVRAHRHHARFEFTKQLPNRDEVDWEVVVIDATEILVQRPKKTEEMV